MDMLFCVFIDLFIANEKDISNTLFDCNLFIL